jgi:predicted Fe-S protein YdhL (DUF1289 family)
MAIKISSPNPGSPCINVCEMDASVGLCKGCLRTIEEITAWSTMSEADKCSVMRQLLSRRLQRQVA